MPVRKVNKLKLTIGLIFIPILVLLALFFLLGDNFDIIKSAFDGDLSSEEVRDVLSGLGIRGKLTITILAMIQVILMFLPAEPVQVLGGLTFGFNTGFLLCLIGVILGNSIIFLLYKLLGDRLRDYFDHKLNIDLDSAGNSTKLSVAIFILYFLPAIPYGTIAFLAVTSGMKFVRFLIVTTLGVIPSICIGCGLGHIALENSIYITLVIFAVLVIILSVIMWKRNAIVSFVNAKLKSGEKSKSAVRQYKASSLNLPYIIFRILIFGKLKFKIVGRVDKIERPSIVLCNHGSFIDFAYAGTILKKESPNFIVNRMYFYEKKLSGLLRTYGCFPKSIFASDTESAMNCVRVIKRGGVLAMMPEARLSTVGLFEDIQESTYDFLKKMGVTVYVINIYGDYLAKPKWGVGLRRGSLVEAKMSLLFTPDELRELELGDIKDRVEKAICYDEIKWLESHPEINYRSRKMAVGLENVLSRCPRCESHYSITTRGKRVRCSCCGMECEITPRYGFKDNKPFANYVEWYEWQFNKIRDEIISDRNFKLSSRVELKHASLDGKKQLRVAGSGVCTLSRDGFTYVGTENGESVDLHFSFSSIYRLLFGAGVDFEFYVGKELYFFVPEEKRSCVDWYIASIVLRDIFINNKVEEFYAEDQENQVCGK